MKKLFHISALQIQIPFIVIALFVTLAQVAFAQSGLWTWVNGDTIPDPNGTYGIKGIADSSNAPPGLYSCTYWKDKQGRFWIYGGKDNSSNYYSDLWMFDPLTSMWTWVYGKQAFNEIPKWNIKGVPDTANCPGARGLGCPAWTDTTGNLWMLGGYTKYNTTTFNYMNDLWKYEISSNTWTWIKGDSVPGLGTSGTMGVPDPANNPQSIAETAAAWTDNQNNFYFYGGNAGSPSNISYRLFRYNVAANEWTWISGTLATVWGIKGVFSPSNTPGRRSVHSCWVDNNGHIWLYGGFGSLTYCCYTNQLWQYDPLINQWAWMSGDSLGGAGILNNAGQICHPADTTQPDNSMECRSVWTDSDGNLWMYGGRTANPNTTFGTSIMWCWLQNKQQWMYAYSPTPNPSFSYNFQPLYGLQGVPDPNSHPGNRVGTGAWKDNQGNFWLWGGFVETSSSQHMKNDMWKYSPDTSCLILSDVSLNHVEENLVEIFPNPATDKLHIKNISNNNFYKTEILNAKGIVIFSNKVTQNQEINISNITSGLYFIKLINTNGEYYCKKILISH